MLSEIGEIVDGVEHRVNRLGNIVMHIESGNFFGLDLLRSNFTVSGEKMQKNRANIGGVVLTGGAIEHGSKVDLINRCNDLRNERLLGSLLEVKRELELAPEIFCGSDLRSGAVGRSNKRAWISRAYPRDGVR
jgi:hypothetical protein